MIVRPSPTMTVAYTVRPATAADSRFVYMLAMDPSVREMSTRSDEFTWEQHCEWWARRFNELTTRIWIMEADGIPVGQVRYGREEHPLVVLEDDGTWTDEWRAEIATSIAPSHWRNGYAFTLLRETMPLACEWLKVQTLVALVLRTNYASRRLFRKAGFWYVGVEVRMEKTHARYERRSEFLWMRR